ncbi:MAG: glycosyltransferase family 4 protein [Chitinophagaceae bacterium]|nr:glycosyltransferase family 4 protein [Bacteroidota bacterium]MCC6256839.1 glycosyltransferase family 4 protein [Chitinophagaceae bacterium]MCW5916981.1 glycosyltransferase family 4 protein [Ferruginibacter sp.]
MRIAYITYEYPPEIENGGIATYTKQISQIIHKLGHEVSVFCATSGNSSVKIENGAVIFRCQTESVEKFADDVLPIFSAAHLQNPFDLFESPEIHAHGLEIKKKFPQLPLIVRLHMASFIQQKLLRAYISLFTKFRFWLGNLRHGKWRFLDDYNYKMDPEYRFTSLAEGITSPSLDQKRLICESWGIPPEKIETIPNPFDPGEVYLNIPVRKKIENLVCFIGKLNTHKGMVSLAKAIPLVLKRHPDTRFLLIGKDSFFFAERMMMSDFIRKTVGRNMNRVTIMDSVPHNEIPEILKDTSLCVFPSLWEAFGLVCLEAMSAGRMVIGSKNGGMSEILSGDAGMLIDPENYREIATQICRGIENEDLRYELGERGRAKAQNNYSSHIIGPAMESYYQKIIRGGTQATG